MRNKKLDIKDASQLFDLNFTNNGYGLTNQERITNIINNVYEFFGYDTKKLAIWCHLPIKELNNHMPSYFIMNFRFEELESIVSTKYTLFKPKVKQVDFLEFKISNNKAYLSNTP